MVNALSAFIVSRYPEEKLSDLLPVENPQSWLKGIASTLYKTLSIQPQKSPAIETSSQGRLVCTIIQTEVLTGEEAVVTLRDWTETFIQQIGHLPLAFYLTVGNTPQTLDLAYIDEGLYRIGGPLFLIEADLWNTNEVFHKEFEGSCAAPFFTGGQSVVVREPETAWLLRLEQNLDRLKNKPGRHPLDYRSGDDASLPPELREERKQLDNVVNFPAPTERKSLKSNKVTVRIQSKESADVVSMRAYQDTPPGGKKNGGKTVGGRALLVSCNNDANRLAGWRPGDKGWRPEDKEYEIHNAASLHFVPSVPHGSLPEAITNGRVILKKAYISGNYIAPELPDINRKPNRMIWPQYNLPNSSPSEEKEK